jgi:hypothetical protein
MTLAAIYAVVMALGLSAYWVLALMTGQVPEVRTEPVRIRMHVAAEFATAIALLVGGVGMLTRSAWGVQAYLVATGMLLYTVIVSPGYFAEKRQWPMVGMFAGVLVLALVSLGLVLTGG